GFVHAFSTLRREAKPISLPIAIYALVVMLAAPHLFQIAKLGWFDSGGVNHAHIKVETPDGRRVEVPNNFFLETSVVFAQQRAGRPFEGFLPTHDWGTTQDLEIMQRFTNRCAPEDPLKPAADPDTITHIGGLIWQHHDRILALENGGDRLNYDLFPHHIWSSPFAYGDFRALDLKSIRAYVLMIEAKCIGMDPMTGAVDVTTLKTEEYRFPADGALLLRE
ncbi:MAG: hypothetical protein ACR2RE_22590, partial [Geminicoccaceae bacterium]